jgi:hypothetical protein
MPDPLSWSTKYSFTYSYHLHIHTRSRPPVSSNSTWPDVNHSGRRNRALDCGVSKPHSTRHIATASFRNFVRSRPDAAAGKMQRSASTQRQSACITPVSGVSIIRGLAGSVPVGEGLLEGDSEVGDAVACLRDHLRRGCRSARERRARCLCKCLETYVSCAPTSPVCWLTKQKIGELESRLSFDLSTSRPPSIPASLNRRPLVSVR